MGSNRHQVDPVVSRILVQQCLGETRLHGAIGPTQFGRERFRDESRAIFLGQPVSRIGALMRARETSQRQCSAVGVQDGQWDLREELRRREQCGAGRFREIGSDESSLISIPRAAFHHENRRHARPEKRLDRSAENRSRYARAPGNSRHDQVECRLAGKLCEQRRGFCASYDDIGIDIRAFEVFTDPTLRVGQLAIGPPPPRPGFANDIIGPIFQGGGDRQARAPFARKDHRAVECPVATRAQIGSQQYSALHDFTFAATSGRFESRTLLPGTPPASPVLPYPTKQATCGPTRLRKLLFL